MDYIDDKVPNINDISEISSDKENMKNDSLITEKQNKNYNSKSVHDEVDKIQSGSRNFYKNNITGSKRLNTSSSSTKTGFTENHGGIQIHSDESRMTDQV